MHNLKGMHNLISQSLIASRNSNLNKHSRPSGAGGGGASSSSGSSGSGDVLLQVLAACGKEAAPPLASTIHSCVQSRRLQKSAPGLPAKTGTGYPISPSPIPFQVCAPKNEGAPPEPLGPYYYEIQKEEAMVRIKERKKGRNRMLFHLSLSKRHLPLLPLIIITCIALLYIISITHL